MEGRVQQKRVEAEGQGGGKGGRSRPVAMGTEKVNFDSIGLVTPGGGEQGFCRAPPLGQHRGMGRPF